MWIWQAILAIAARPEWWLVIIAALTGGVVGWQSWETRRSAKAALLNAKAIIGAERAWIVVREVEGRPTQNYQTRMPDVCVSIHFTNKGRSPAFLLEGECKYAVCPRGTMLPAVSDLDWKPSKDINQRPGICIQPGEEYHLRNIKCGIVIPDMQRLYEGEEVLWVYGMLNYRDVFGRLQETWYCYRWESHNDTEFIPQWIPDGPAGYNRATYQYEKM
jgi:hypothetical protein